MKAVYMSDLAQLYFPRSTPRSASSQLHRWITLNTELMERLEGDGQVLFNVCIRGRQVCLRLVIVVVGNVIFHRIVGEERLELPVELGGQRLVVAQDQRRFVDVADHVGDGKSLSGACHSQQCLGGQAVQYSVSQLCDSLRLVAGGLIVGFQFKVHNQ